MCHWPGTPVPVPTARVRVELWQDVPTCRSIDEVLREQIAGLAYSALFVIGPSVPQYTGLRRAITFAGDVAGSYANRRVPIRDFRPRRVVAKTPAALRHVSPGPLIPDPSPPEYRWRRGKSSLEAHPGLRRLRSGLTVRRLQRPRRLARVPLAGYSRASADGASVG